MEIRWQGLFVLLGTTDAIREIRSVRKRRGDESIFGYFYEIRIWALKERVLFRFSFFLFGIYFFHVQILRKIRDYELFREYNRNVNDIYLHI